MKNTLLYFAFLVVFSNILSAQVIPSLENAAMDNYFNDQSHIPKVTGHFVHFNTTDLRDQIITYTLVVPSVEFQVENTAKVNADGSFELVLTHPLPYQQIWFQLGDIYYGEIIALKDLHIEADIAVLKQDTLTWWGKGIAFSGSDAGINEMVNRFLAEKNDQIQGIISGTTQKKMDLTVSNAKMQEADKAIAEIEKTFLASYPSDVRWLLENERMSEYYGNVIMLYNRSRAAMEPSLLHAILSHQPAIVSNSSMCFYRYLGYYLNNQFKTGLAAGIDSLGISPRKAELILLAGASRKPEEKAPYFEKNASRLNSSWVKMVVAREMQDTRELIDRINTNISNAKMPSGNVSELGLPVAAFAFHADLYESVYSSADSLIAGIRSAYPGQAIILDIWATWCGPCVQDMKNSASRKKEMEGMPVKIVYLCVDRNSSADLWKKTVAQLESSGTHIYLNKTLTGDIMKSYSLSGYPSYLLIDKDGKVHKGVVSNIANLDIVSLKRFL